MMNAAIGSKIGTALSILVVAAMVAVAGALTMAGSSLLLDAASKRLAHTTATVSLRLQEIFEDILQDTDFLAHTAAVRRLARHQDAAPTLGGPRPGWDDELADLFEAFLASRPWYFQVRLISTRDRGREVVRVERVGEQIVRTPETELQEKAHRDYFSSAMKLTSDTLLLSRIDLNRERGEISKPYMPTLRGVRPVFGDDGTTIAMVVINVAMQPVFQAAEALLDPDSNLIVTNADGDYLFHPDPDKTFGFDFGTRFRVSDQIQQTEGLIKGTETRIALEDVEFPAERHSAAFFERLDLPGQDGDRFLLVGVTTPRSVVLADVDEIRKRSAGYTFLFTLAAALAAVFATRVLIRPLHQMARAVADVNRGRHEILLPVSRQDELGEMARGLQTIIANTAVKEKQIDRRLRELESKEQRLRTLVQTLSEAVLAVGEDGRVQDANPLALDLFGYSREELVGHHISTLVPELGTTPLAGSPGLARRAQGRRKGGDLLSLELSWSTVQDANHEQIILVLRRD